MFGRSVQPTTAARSRDRVEGPADARFRRRTLRIIESNLFRAFGYDVAAIQLAAAGLLDPKLAGAAMAGGPVFVVTNSLRLRSCKAQAEHR